MITLHIPSSVQIHFFQQRGKHFLQIAGPEGLIKWNISKFKQLLLRTKSSTIEICSFFDVRSAQNEAKAFSSKLQGLIEGVQRPYNVSLQLRGLGYRWTLEDHTLVLQIHASHPVYFKLPLEIQCQILNPTELTLWCVDPNQLGQMAQKICALHPKDPYKGKGIWRLGEETTLKEKKRKS